MTDEQAPVERIVEELDATVEPRPLEVAFNAALQRLLLPKLVEQFKVKRPKDDTT